MKYDDAYQHFAVKAPKGFPKEYGGTHIGLFLKWSFIKGWAGEHHLTESASSVQRVIDGAMSGTSFLFLHCSGKLTDTDLSAKGNWFASHYYTPTGGYLDDYEEQFGSLMYRAPESEHDFDLFSEMVNSRFAEFDHEEEELPTAESLITPQREEPKKKPWWKFWK